MQACLYSDYASRTFGKTRNARVYYGTMKLVDAEKLQITVATPVAAQSLAARCLPLVAMRKVTSPYAC